jgi:acyl-coenzyme A synthetase/AMP-(fatty) acid ligase
MMYVAEHVAPYKRVRRVTFIDGIPRAASGKILRRELRTPHDARGTQDVPELKEPS